MIDGLLKKYPCLSVCYDDIEKARTEIINCYEKGGKLLLCGNGGSAADCEHITGELLKGFLKRRPISEEKISVMTKNCPEAGKILRKLQSGLPAVALSSLTSLNTAFSNDEDSELIYAQGVLALGKSDDVLLCLSTSGNSKNVVAAAKTAKAMEMSVIGLSGGDGGALKEFCSICITVPEKETFMIQELHLPVYHMLCASVEAHFFKE